MLDVIIQAFMGIVPQLLGLLILFLTPIIAFVLLKYLGMNIEDAEIARILKYLASIFFELEEDDPELKRDKLIQVAVQYAEHSDFINEKRKCLIKKRFDTTKRAITYAIRHHKT